MQRFAPIPFLFQLWHKQPSLLCPFLNVPPPVLLGFTMVMLLRSQANVVLTFLIQSTPLLSAPNTYLWLIQLHLLRKKNYGLLLLPLPLLLENNKETSEESLFTSIDRFAA
ncbi:hypothetical protein C5167_049593 [Papaver somniferum]|uniref:Uncharacterized protein n=1 Tax=Papaver somniferum TaxID=3469 RepID=A0A4Y7KL95_PAPSO|nr:hypothetical protein C5167_049593 [Papaver somniferum]